MGLARVTCKTQKKLHIGVPSDLLNGFLIIRGKLLLD